MKKLAIILTILLVGMSALTLAACGEDNGTRKYVIFTDNYGNEYRIDSPQQKEFSVYYDKDKTYSFTYKAYYVKTNKPTGESGSFTYTAKDIREYTFFASVSIDGIKQDYILKFVILPAPDLRIEPEIIFFDPNGTDGFIGFINGKYVYQYDGNGYKYPDFRVLDENGMVLELKAYYIFAHHGGWGVDIANYLSGRKEYSQYTKDGITVKFPIEPGTYQISYSAEYSEENNLIYKPASKIITIVIIP